VAVLGPAPAPLARLRGRTRWQLFLRGVERPALRQLAQALQGGAHVPRGVRITVDVDPMSAL
jgi:primosomal protein N' (replication factor Y)